MNKPLPEDPMMRELVQMARRHQMTRRAALAGAGATAATLALAACAPGGSTGAALTAAKNLVSTKVTDKQTLLANITKVEAATERKNAATNAAASHLFQSH